MSNPVVLSTPGRRLKNEDYADALRNNGRLVIAVADGLGGHTHGEVASKLAVSVVMEELLRAKEITPDVLKSSFEKAHERILLEASGELKGMGTTLVVAVVEGNRSLIGWCGDSRAYLIRGGEIVAKTKDHSLVQEMVDKGEITEEEAKTHPQRNIVTHALGVDFGFSSLEWELERGDYLLLSTDGLHDYIDEEDILATIETDSLKEIADSLILTALENGSMDNITLALYRHSEDYSLPSKGLVVVHGPLGSGKTHKLWNIMKTLAAKGFMNYYINVKERLILNTSNVFEVLTEGTEVAPRIYDGFPVPAGKDPFRDIVRYLDSVGNTVVVMDGFEKLESVLRPCELLELKEFLVELSRKYLVLVGTRNPGIFEDEAVLFLEVTGVKDPVGFLVANGLPYEKARKIKATTKNPVELLNAVKSTD